MVATDGDGGDATESHGDGRHVKLPPCDFRAPPMSLLTAGWRTDGMTLVDAARSLIADEVRLFCPPPRRCRRRRRRRRRRR